VPIYDYACSHCGRVTEVIHGINDAGPRFCPECGAEGTMRKAMSAPSIVFKGSGWAKIDRRASSGRSSSGGGSKAPSSDVDAGSSAHRDKGGGDKGRDDARTKVSASDNAGSGSGSGDPGAGATSSDGAGSKGSSGGSASGAASGTGGD
jgi:putative FmdB family regulatory protein